MNKDALQPWGRWVATLGGLSLLPGVLACSQTRTPSGYRGPSGDGGPAVALDPGYKGIHVLNSTEYNATIQDVLGTDLQPADSSWRGGEDVGFDNIWSALSVDQAQYNRYFVAAGALTSEVLASPMLLGRFVSCTLSSPDCVRASIQAAGLRLFRRPLAQEELTTYQGVYNAARALGDDEPSAFGLALQALLSSAEFLYRIEIDPQPASTASHPVDPFELASRLSYFLWSSGPDDALLTAAADGSLAQADTLSVTIDRMLDDPKSKRLVTNFAGQWLGARAVLSHAVAPNYYEWSRQVAQAASAKILLYFDDFLRSGRSWLEFPTADINFVDAALAYFYGMPAATAAEVGMPVRVDNYTADQRNGFFGLAGFLAVSSFDRRTSPSLRGRWIAGTVLCSTPPPPPPNVPVLDEEGADGGADGGDGSTSTTVNVRQSLEKHRASAACSVCHATFDPYGLALEQFDGVGIRRTTYGDGTTIDVSVTLPPSDTFPQGQSFSGLDGLASTVAADPRLGACLAKQLLTYGLGRRMDQPNDEAHLQHALDKWRTPGQTPSLRRLVHALVSTDAFRLRRGDDVPGGDK